MFHRLENISVRVRELRGGNARAGTDYTWTEYQVVSGRTVVSRHDTEELATKAAESLRLSRERRNG
jgi:hypothetical protein